MHVGPCNLLTSHGGWVVQTSTLESSLVHPANLRQTAFSDGLHFQWIPETINSVTDKVAGGTKMQEVVAPSCMEEGY